MELKWQGRPNVVNGSVYVLIPRNIVGHMGFDPAQTIVNAVAEGSGDKVIITLTLTPDPLAQPTEKSDGK